MKAEASVLVAEAFSLLGVQDFRNLSLAYSREDQKLMKSGGWDARNPDLITNRVKTLLERIDPNDLIESDREWWSEILWFWYHHAVSCERSRIKAQSYAAKALELQGDDHPNRITKLLWFLTHDRVDEAKRWVAEAPPDTDRIEHQTGLDLIREYEQRKFWE